MAAVMYCPRYCLPPNLRDVPPFIQKCELEGIILSLSLWSLHFLILLNEWSQSYKSYFKSIAEEQKGLKMKVNNSRPSFRTDSLTVG